MDSQPKRALAKTIGKSTTCSSRVQFFSDQVRSKMAEERARRRPKGKQLVDLKSVMSKPTMQSAKDHLENPLNAGRPFLVCATDVELAAITSAAGGVGYAYNFQLDQWPAFADYVALFDQYRITKITAHIMPRSNTNNLTVASSAATATVSPIMVAFDPDDATAPTSANQVLAYPVARFYPGYKTFKYAWKPRAAIAAYGGAFTQFADFDGWCDCASDDVEWYALKVWQAGSGASQTTFQVWDIFYQVEAEFRFVH